MSIVPHVDIFSKSSESDNTGLHTHVNKFVNSVDKFAASGNRSGKTELLRRRMAFVHHVNNLVAQAAELGVVLTIEQKPLLPLAMGHHETLVSIRPVRNGGAS